MISLRAMVRLSMWSVRSGAPQSPAVVEWVCGSTVNVSDVGSIDVGVMSGSECGKNVCCVVGDGVQLFSLTF